MARKYIAPHSQGQQGQQSAPVKLSATQIYPGTISTKQLVMPILKANGGLAGETKTIEMLRSALWDSTPPHKGFPNVRFHLRNEMLDKLLLGSGNPVVSDSFNFHPSGKRHMSHEPNEHVIHAFFEVALDLWLAPFPPNFDGGAGKISWNIPDDKVIIDSWVFTRVQNSHMMNAVF